MKIIILITGLVVYASSARLDHLQYLPPHTNNAYYTSPSNFASELTAKLNEYDPAEPSFPIDQEHHDGQDATNSLHNIGNHQNLPLNFASDSKENHDEHTSTSAFALDDQRLGSKFVQDYHNPSINNFDAESNRDDINFETTSEFPSLIRPSNSFSNEQASPTPTSQQTFAPNVFATNPDQFIPNVSTGQQLGSNNNGHNNQIIGSEINVGSTSNNPDAVDSSGHVIGDAELITQQNNIRAPSIASPEKGLAQPVNSFNPFSEKFSSNPSQSQFQAPPTEIIPVLRSVSNNNADGTYQYAYETANNIVALEEGDARFDGTKAQGFYSYISPEGKKIEVTYTADERGFLPQGEHIPTAPPVPEAILKSLEYIKRVEEERRLRGDVLDDGQYHDDYDNVNNGAGDPSHFSSGINQGPSQSQSNKFSDTLSIINGSVDEIALEISRPQDLEDGHNQVDTKNQFDDHNGVQNFPSDPSFPVNVDADRKTFLPFSDPTSSAGEQQNPDYIGTGANEFLPNESKDDQHEGYRY